MFELEYGAEYANSVKVIFSPENWDTEMTNLSNDLADMVDRMFIDPEDFEQAMEWITGVVVEDYVRVPAHFGALTIALTFHNDGPACDWCSKDITEKQCIGSQARTGEIRCAECETLV